MGGLLILRIWIFSDIHNNYYALKMLYEYISTSYISGDKVFFLGDFLGYLKFDKRIIDLLIKMYKNFNLKMIVGNHDAVFFNYINKTNLKIDISDSLIQTIENNIIHRNDILEIFPFINLNKFSLVTNDKKYVLSHGGISDILNHYYYPDLDFIEKYKGHFEPNIIYICGHTHWPFLYSYNNSNIFINVGSIGLPRDNNPESSFLEIKKNSFIIKRRFYQLDKAYEYNSTLSNKIKNRIYFGGKSSYLNFPLIDVQTDYKFIKHQFKNIYFFKRAIYIKDDKKLWQIYKIIFKGKKKYLLRDLYYEKMYDSLPDLIRRIKNGSKG